MTRRTLEAIFRDHLSETGCRTFEGISKQGDALARWLAEVQLAWPELQMDEEAFCAYLAPRIPDDVAELSSWRVDLLYFCFACIDRQQAAVGVFMAKMVPVIGHALRKLQLGGTLREDAQQEIVSWLLVGDGDRLPLLANYRGYGKLERWLRVVTARNGRRLLARRSATLPREMPSSPGNSWMM